LSYAGEHWTARRQAERMLGFYHHLIEEYRLSAVKPAFQPALADSQQVNAEF